MLQNKNCDIYVVTYLHLGTILLMTIYSVKYHPFPGQNCSSLCLLFFTKSLTFIAFIIFTFVPLTIARVLVCPSDTAHWK